MIVMVIILHLLCTNDDSMRHAGRQDPNGEAPVSDICQSMGAGEPRPAAHSPPSRQPRLASAGYRTRLTMRTSPRTNERTVQMRIVRGITDSCLPPLATHRPSDTDTVHRVAYHQTSREEGVR